MNILMVLERNFPPDLRVENEIKALIKNNHQVILACYSLNQKDKLNEYFWSSCKVYKRRISKLDYKSSVGALKFPLYFNFWRKHINFILSKEKIDAIHIHDLPLAKIGSEIREKQAVKFVLDLHENWPAYLRVSKHSNKTLGKILSNNKQWEKYEIEYCQKADNVIVVVDEAKTRLARLGINADKITVVSNYPETSDFENIPYFEPEKDKIVLYYAGGIAEHRGIQFIIWALPKVLKKYPQVELRIFGSGTYQLELETLVKELQLGKHVIFFGQVPYKIVLEELAKAHIALIPHTKNEHTDSTIPHKLFQYMYAGKPVLASDCTPILRIINETRYGRIYRWNDIDDLARSMSFLIENLESFDGTKIVDIIKEKYSWNKEKKKLVQIYS